MFLVSALILGILPSLVWLIYYLKSDIHPEPKSIIMEVFLLGMVSGGAAIGFQYLLMYLGASNEFIESIVFAFPAIMVIGWAFIEEYVKYLAAKIRILHDSEFDEPTDAMIYLIAAGLGFAAIENTLFVLPSIFDGEVYFALNFLFLRFITATLLHALASGIIGFFFALAIIYHSRLNLFMGFVLGISLHAFYNYSIMLSDWQYRYIALPLILFVGIIIIKVAFYKLRSKRFG